MNQWILKKFQHKLNDAPFDTDDPFLLREIGSCTSCFYNTGSNSLLFPDMVSDPTCQNPTCFKKKCDVSYKAEFTKVIEDPTALIISSQHNPEKESKEIINKHPGILTARDYSVVSKPKIRTRDYFDGDNDTVVEDEKDYQDHLDDVRKATEAYNQKVASGKFKKAFVIDGDSKGHYVYVNITSKASKNGHAKSEVAANKSPAIEAEEIKDEIGRIRDREKRAIELDDAKVWADIYSHLEPAKVIKDITPGPLTQVERNAVAAALMGELD